MGTGKHSERSPKRQLIEQPKARSRRHNGRTIKLIESQLILLLIASLFLGAAYAKIEDDYMYIDGTAVAAVQDGVFILDIVRNSGDATGSIDCYSQALLRSTITLGNTASSKIVYTMTLYNNSDKEKLFMGVITDKSDTTYYSNPKIDYSVETVGEIQGIQQYVTTIQPNSTLIFPLTFKYAEGVDPTSFTAEERVLDSKLNFRFIDLPQIAMTEKIELTGLYPNCTPQEYEFTVTGSGENSVPMGYKLSATLPSPLTAEILTQEGNVVANETVNNLEINGDQTTTHTYKLKVSWNSENAVVESANTTLEGAINLVATPTASTEGQGYQLTKQTAISAKTAPLYLATTLSSESVEMNQQKATLNLTVTDKEGDNTNPYETTYKITPVDSKFVLKIDGAEVTSTGITKTIKNTSQTLAIELIPKDLSTITGQEECNIIIETTKPYTKTTTLKITVKDTIGPTAPEITGGSEAYATSRTIKVITESVDQGTGVAYYEYYVANNATRPTKETQATKITDKTGPTAPVITGGGDTYALSRTITVSQDAVDEESGVAYYEYYLTPDSTPPNKNTPATGRVE